MLRGVGRPVVPRDPGATTRHLRMVVPGLAEEPVMGGGCCSFVLAEDALAEALAAWSGVLGVEVDTDRGSIDLWLGSPSPELDDLVGTVSELGYEVDAVQGDEQR